MKENLIKILALVFFAFLIGYFLGVSKINIDWKTYNPSLNIVSKEPPIGTTNIDFTPFWAVWQKLSTDYYDKSKLDQQKMLNGAITGMVQSIGDPFTLYLPPVANKDFKQGLAGQFSGIGAELGIKDKDIIVISPLDGSPAATAGVKAGDVIRYVDGNPTVGWSLSQAVEKIRGPKGTTVTLTLIHKDTQKQVEIKIVRDTITVKSVSMGIQSANCGKDKCQLVAKTDKCTGSGCVEYVYIRLSQFGDNTYQEWSDMVSQISNKIKSDRSIKGVIFDLRNNPGGYLDDATFIASEFLPKGKVVVKQDDGQTEEEIKKVERDGALLAPKLVILIDKGSASAAEIVSGALRDNQRAKLVGEKSFGKGTVQEAADLGGGAGLHVTIAKWLTPNGTWVNGNGLTPDVSVSLDPKNPEVDTQLEKAVWELLK